MLKIIAILFKIIFAIIVLGVLFIILLLLVVFGYGRLRYGYTFDKNTKCTKNCTKEVNLGEEFRIIRGEVAMLKNTSLTLSVKSFENNPRSSWNGPRVNYEVTQDGVTYENLRDYCNGNPPYYFTVVDSDYASTAIMRIDEPEAECYSYLSKGYDSDRCFENLVICRYYKAKYCEVITDKNIQDDCYGFMATRTNNAEYCKKMSNNQNMELCMTEVGMESNARTKWR